jgi:outer membrane protein TolC
MSRFLPNWKWGGGTVTAALPLVFLTVTGNSFAQQAVPVQASDANPASVVITLQEAITRAKANEPTLAAAVAANKVAALDHSLARAALLPSVVFHNQYLYTEPSRFIGKPPATAPAAQTVQRFIANNAVHEYTSQGVVTETLGVQQVTAVAKASASASVASAELEIAQRGLVATVVGLYYGAITADRKLAVARRSADEAASFTHLTQQREDAREVAHADVIKAQLQEQQRQRDLADAALQQQKSRLDLAVLLFPDPHTPYSLADADEQSDLKPLAPKADIQAAAAKLNPELRSALASQRAASLDVTGARAAYLPDLGLNFNYGIDAAQFAVNSPDHYRNLGYSASVTVDLPVWDWFSTHDRIKQKIAQRDSASVNLTQTQRKLIAQIDEFYDEATVARDQLQSLDTSVSTARESLRLTRLRYTAGEATVLEVVDAQNSLITVETAKEDGVLRYRAALADLQILTGTL